MELELHELGLIVRCWQRYLSNSKDITNEDKQEYKMLVDTIVETLTPDQS